MSNILCKIGLHKMRKVKSTKTTVIKLMEDIIRAENKILLPLNSEEIICRKFGINRDNIWIGYDAYDKVCIRPGCNYYNPIITKKRDTLVALRNQVVRKEIKNKNKDKLIENIYRGCKSGS